MRPVLVTGATGFVGRTLCEALAQSGQAVRAALRSDRPVPVTVAETVVVGDIGASTDWVSALSGVEAVVHLAARAHVMHDSPARADAYFETNERGTQRLAEAAVRAGVRRFVFLSSVKVNGETSGSSPCSDEDTPRPQDVYGRSKWFAERHLWEIAAASAMEVVIVRSPLVYGPGVRANFLRLLRWVDEELPLPLGSVRNARSLVNVWNLSDLLVHVLQHTVAAGRTWMVSDGEDLSTPGLIRRIAIAMNRRVRLVSIPVPLLRACGTLTGQKPLIERLCGSLAVDITPARRDLGWSPRVPVDEALTRTVGWYLAQT